MPRVLSAGKPRCLIGFVRTAATTRGARLSRPSSDPGLLQALGIPARPGSLAELALTHRSFAFEQPETTPHNERLEFLGDAVLQGIVTEFIYRSYPELPEGEMARLRASVVEKRTLAIVARDIGLGHHLRLGKGEEASGGRDKSSLLADALEALIGAAFIERDGRHLAEVLVPVFAELIEDVVAAGGGQDPKGALQEKVARDLGLRPSYRVSSAGPDHDKRFTAQVLVDGEVVGDGVGRSKKEAELHAAREALGGWSAPVLPVGGKRSA